VAVPIIAFTDDSKDGIEGIILKYPTPLSQTITLSLIRHIFCGGVPFENPASDEVNASADVQFRQI